MRCFEGLEPSIRSRGFRKSVLWVHHMHAFVVFGETLGIVYKQLRLIASVLCSRALRMYHVLVTHEVTIQHVLVYTCRMEKGLCRR